MKAAIVSELERQAVLLRKKAVKASATADRVDEPRRRIYVGAAIAYRDAARSLVGRAKRVRKARR